MPVTRILLPVIVAIYCYMKLVGLIVIGIIVTYRVSFVI